jgi:plasmid stability protein
MPTLYVENVPEELYEALRARARAERKSISAEVLSLLSENVPTPEEIARRLQLIKRASVLRSQGKRVKGAMTAEEMQREDRNR